MPKAKLSEESQGIIKEQLEGMEYYALVYFAQHDFQTGANAVSVWTGLRKLLDGHDALPGGYEDTSPFRFLAEAAKRRLDEGMPHYEIPFIGAPPVVVNRHPDETGIRECISARGACTTEAGNGSHDQS